MTQEIKNCPFCDLAGSIVIDDFGYSGGCSDPEQKCLGFDIVSAETYEQAAGKWNTRAAQPVNEELLDSSLMRRDADAPANDTQEGSERYAQGWNDAINAIRKSIANAEAQNDGWSPIESAPRDGTYVVLFAQHHAEEYTMDVRRFKDGYWRSISCTNSPDYYTHWRPLPAPPSEKGA